MKKKSIAMLMAVVMLMGVAIGGTVAWLTSKTDPVVNTFTVGDINITLAESDSDDADADATVNSYKMVPGNTITKDPKVTVKAGSEACWLFVKVAEANWPECMEADGVTRKVNYAIASGWEKLDGETFVYYRQVPSLVGATGDSEFAVLADNQVTVSSTLTKTECNAIQTNPTLTITAYAIQSANLTDQNGDSTVDAVDAWALLNS